MGAEATTRVAIIPDELSERVREQAVRATRGLGDKRLGGMSRTEASRTYLFQWTAGLWRVSWEYDHNRDQPTSLRPLSLPQATKLRPEGDHTRRSSGARTPGCTQSEAASGGPREELVQALPQHLKDTKHKKVSEQEAPDRAAGQLELRERPSRCNRELLRAIRECGGSARCSLNWGSGGRAGACRRQAGGNDAGTQTGYH
jgi:hypothetical protein